MIPRNSPLECGCRASHDSSGEHYIEMCPVHEAAQDLLKACEGALRIQTLWMPPDAQNDPDHDSEFAALTMMRQAFREAIASATESWETTT